MGSHSPLFVRKEMAKESSFSDISFMTIVAGNHPQREHQSEALPLVSKNLTNNQP